MASADTQIADLSGGNQQKVVLARWLALQPKVLIVDEPTRGIDIAAKAEVHQQLDAMARSGIAVIAISSELPEVLAISDRIVTMREGRITGGMPRDRATEEALMHLMAIDPAAASPAGQEGATMSDAALRKLRAGARSAGSRIIPLLSRHAPAVCLVLLMVMFAILEPSVPVAAQSVQRDAPDLDRGADRDRHDLRHPDRRHRPVGGLAGGGGRPGRRA